MPGLADSRPRGESTRPARARRRRAPGRSSSTGSTAARRRACASRPSCAGRTAVAADHLPRRPRRPGEPGRLPPHGPDRVAGPRGRRPLRPRPRRPPAGPDRLLDGRLDRRPIHGALAARGQGRRVDPRRARARLAGGSSNSTRPRWACPASPRCRSSGRSARGSTPTGTASTRSGTAEDFQLPILLFHGTDDEIVPIETSDELRRGAAAPGWNYYRVPEARPHPGLERRPAALRARVLVFLEKSMQPAFTAQKTPQNAASPTGVGLEL